MTARSDAGMAAKTVPGASPWWAGVLGWIGMAMDRHAQRRHLASLDPRLLRDVGLTRAQALAQARRPWWQA